MSVVSEHHIGPTTVEEWLTREHPVDGSRLELILGYLHMNPPTSGQHQRAAYLLTRMLDDALREGGRSGLYAVPGVGVEISTPWRTALIPDVSVLNTPPVGTSFRPENLVLAVEIWSPGNSHDERNTKTAAYAGAQVPYFWAVNQDRLGGMALTAYLLKSGRYAEDVIAVPGTPTTITAAPVPVHLNPADLAP